MTGFAHGRVPLEDPDVEEARKDAYWEWLDGRGLSDVAGEPGWHLLKGEYDADFEAFHMRHSIGHSWAHYSTFGEIWSLRSDDGVPKVTALVSGGAVVHAREAHNMRLSPMHEAELASFAAMNGWRIAPDRHPFETRDGEGGNTLLRYALRDPAGGGSVAEVVLAGPFSQDDVALAAGTGDGRSFDAGFLRGVEGFPFPDADVVEIVLIAPTTQPSSTASSFEALARSIANASALRP